MIAHRLQGLWAWKCGLIGVPRAVLLGNLACLCLGASTCASMAAWLAGLCKPGTTLTNAVCQAVACAGACAR